MLNHSKGFAIKMLYSVTVLVLLFISSSFSDDDLPSHLPKCYLDDPELNECFMEAFNKLRPLTSNGIEEIGLPPLNPFVISQIKIRQDTPMANYTMTCRNLTIGGLDNYDIKEFHYDPNTMIFRFRMEFETLPMFAFYEASGHVAHIPLEGKGVGWVTLGAVNADFEIKGSMRKSRGIDYYNTNNANVKLNAGDAYCHLEGLFGNDYQLERMTNQMLNSNSDMVIEAGTPMLEKICEIGVMRFMKTLTRIPYYKLLPRSH